MSPPVAGYDEDDGFQVVGRKGRALPGKARRNLAMKDGPTLALSKAAENLPSRLSSAKRSQPWTSSERPKLSVAPMMQWTDPHYRSFARLLTQQTLLFTEMIPAAAIVDAKAEGCLDKLLAFDASHRPLAVQIGGCSPELMAEAAQLCADAGFDEVNLNVGCPSSKVTTGGYGACLMKSPKLVAEIAGATLEACRSQGVPVTVKHRLGVDDCDSWEELVAFVKIVASAGVTHFIVHARKALLGFLSCEGNRTIPPLKYDWVRSLAATFPEFTFELNGGVTSLGEAQQLLAEGVVAGVMVGRAAYQTPWAILATADADIFGSESPGLSRQQVLERYLDYAAAVFHAEQRLGKVSTPSAALELEELLAAPVAHLFEDLSHVFRTVLLREVAETHRSSPPTFSLRRAASLAVQSLDQKLL